MAFSSMRGALVVALVFPLACVPTTDQDDDDGSSSTSEAGTSTGAASDSTVTADTALTDTTADASGSTLEGTSEGGTCTLPAVEQEVLDFLFIDAGMTSFVAAGSGTQLRLVWIDDGYPTEVEACVEWSIAPVDGVGIDASGLLTVDASVPTGTTISVTADVEDGRRILMADFEVYVPVEYDIIGFWTEVQQLPCDGGAAFVPDPSIGELVFEDTGEFSVTWTPFEVYYDYWGTYTYDPGTGALVLTVDGGNYVPDDIDGEGTATVTGGQLTLEDMWLGVAQEPVTPVACGHVFE